MAILLFGNGLLDQPRELARGRLINGTLLQDQVAELVHVDGLSRLVRQSCELEGLVLDVKVARICVEMVARASVEVRTLEMDIGRRVEKRRKGMSFFYSALTGMVT